MKRLASLLYLLFACSLIVSAQNAGKWTGSGFALNGRYIITNHHVVDNANSLKVRGIKGDFTKRYNAIVVATDTSHDLAIIKITDSYFPGFGNIPYGLRSEIANVGEDVFALGYPIISHMGEEVKLTTGIISSLSGYKGEVSAYQMSAPVQPGNSGGPLFNNNGDLIGVVNAGIPDAQNVGYAIKSPYLRLFIESRIGSSIIPSNGRLKGLSLVEKVKAIKPFVFIIEGSSNGKSGSSNQSGSGSSSTSRRKVGEVVNINGVAGIILSLDSSGEHGLVVSLKQTKANWSGANSWCERLGKYWILPNREALKYLYYNKATINATLTKMGQPLLDTTYWSSDTYGSDYGYYVNISTGYIDVNYKSSYSSVRAMYVF